MRGRVLILMLALIAAGLYLGMACGSGSTPGATDLRDLPEGRIDRDQAIEAGKLIANLERFTIESSNAQEKTLAEYAAGQGTSLGEVMKPDRNVWVVSFNGSGVNTSDSASSSHSVFEVVFDKETGEVVAVAYRN